jgi:hypothetical protein
MSGLIAGGNDGAGTILMGQEDEDNDSFLATVGTSSESDCFNQVEPYAGDIAQPPWTPPAAPPSPPDSGCLRG